MGLNAVEIGCRRGYIDLFSGATFDIAGGEALQVTGANGSGKSSLLRILCGLAEPAEGEVRWEGRPIRRMREEYRGKLAYIGHASGLKNELLAWENLSMMARLHGLVVDMDQACGVLEQLGLLHVAGLPALSLSQGQRKRLALARLWLDLPQPLWILDEPFTALDSGAVRAVCMRLGRHLDRGGLLVYTTHQEVAPGFGRQQRLDLGEGAAC